MSREELDSITGKHAVSWYPSGKESACSAGDAGDPSSIPGSGRSSGEENGHPLQYSCLENPVDRGAWQATVHGVTRVGYDLVTRSMYNINSLLILKYLEKEKL